VLFPYLLTPLLSLPCQHDHWYFYQWDLVFVPPFKASTLATARNVTKNAHIVRFRNVPPQLIHNIAYLSSDDLVT
jgi:hypothetical protein